MIQNKKIYVAWFWGVLFLLSWSKTEAQTTVQVVTKTVEKSLDFGKDFSMSIDAEKADITIKTDANIKQVSVKLDMIAKHPQAEIAKKDLDYLKNVIEIYGKNIYIRNYVAIEKGNEKPKSDLRTRYTITLPPNMPVVLKNNFGKINIIDLKSKLSIVSEFCKTLLENLEGEIAIDAKYGDIVGNKMGAKIAITSLRTDINLNILRGQCDIKAQYGKIQIDADKKMTALNVIAEKADVKVSPPEGNVAYNLDAEFGKVNTPKGSTLKYAERSKEREKIVWTPAAAQLSIFIQTSFGTIELVNPQAP